MLFNTRFLQKYPSPLGICLALLFLSSWGVAQSVKGAKTTKGDRNAKIVDQLFEYHKAGNVDGVLNLYADDARVEWASGRLACLNKTAFTGVLKQRMSAESQTVSDRDVTINHRIQSDEWTVVEGEWKGTVEGKPISFRFVSMLKIKDGRIVQQIDYSDTGPVQHLRPR